MHGCFAHWKIFPFPPYVSKTPSRLITCRVTFTYFIWIFGRATPTVTTYRRNLNSQCIQHVKFLRPTLPCCRETLPESFRNAAKGGPQGNFSLGSKYKFLPKPTHLMGNFLYISLLKTVFCCQAQFYHNASFNTGHLLV